MSILAIDQGGTKTAVLTGDEQGRILSVGYGEGACHFVDGVERALHCIDQALRDSHCREAFGQISAGLSGANWPDEVEMLEGVLKRRFCAAHVRVTNDCVIALYGGSTLDNAVILCAGSGFNCAVRVGGKIAFLYNNYIEAIDAGGSGLAARALQAVFRAETGMGPRTSLAERALEYFGHDTVLSLLLDYTRGRLTTPLKDFAYHVNREALKSDEAALSVQRAFGASVSRYATAAIRRYGLVGKPVDVVLSGGVFKGESPVLVDAVRDAVHAVSAAASVVNARYEPVVGAYLLGLIKRFGWPPAAEILCNVEKTARAHGLLRLEKERDCL